MRFALIASRQDPAGMAIHRELLRAFPFVSTDSVFQGSPVCRYEGGGIAVSLYLLQDPLTESDNLERSIEADAFVFLSKHRSAANTRSFAVHSIGNWAEEKGGGKAGMLCPATALLQHAIFLQLLHRQREGYEVTMEATHHGPYMEKPSVFVEVGSTEEEWGDAGNGRVIAESVMGGIDGYVHHTGANEKRPMGKGSNEKDPMLDGNAKNPAKSDDDNNGRGGRGENGGGRKEAPKVAIGIGGPHYCNNFNKVAQRRNIAFSHICPKHRLKNLNEELLRQAIEKTQEKIHMIVLDWKGLGKEKQRIAELVKGFDIFIKRADQLLKE